MKRVACLSTILPSADESSASSNVIDIYNLTVNYNSDHKITGSFLVSNNFVLLVMEGDSIEVGQIVFKIRQDKRLNDFSFIHKSEISEPKFSSWGIKVLREDLKGQLTFLRKLKSILRSDLDLKSELDRERMKCFLPPSQASTKSAEVTLKKKPVKTEPTVTLSDGTSTQTSEFSGYAMSLNSWPTPGLIKLNGELIKICARLVRRPQPYEELLALGIFSSKGMLDKYLNDLNKLGILKKHRTISKPNLVGIKGGPPKPKQSAGVDRFSTVLKNFLKASKHRS
ncbi:BLUF domain-containing protein [Aurantivibrio infirmus]